MTRLHRDEAGAAAVTTILFAVVMFGCAAMVMDGGGTLMLKRQMVTAADAAALAAASSCAQDKTDQYTRALETAQQNVPAATPVGAVTCNASAKTVTVTYQTSRALSFAPLLGFDSTTVTTSATAMWGPSRSAAPVPLGLGDEPTACTSSPPPAVGTSCVYWFSSNSLGVSGNWGFLDFSSLNNTGRCTGSAGRLGGQIRDNETLYELNPSGGTPICASAGDPRSPWDALAEQIGKVRAFPVIDPAVSDGRTSTILGYVPLRVDAVWDGPGSMGSPPAACGPRPGRAMAMACVIASYQGPVTSPGPIGGGIDLVNRTFRLKS